MRTRGGSPEAMSAVAPGTPRSTEVTSPAAAGETRQAEKAWPSGGSCVREKEQPQAPRALITGITCQDGLCLAEFLAAKGYEVFRMVRAQSNPEIPVVEKLIPSISQLSAILVAVAPVQGP